MTGPIKNARHERFAQERAKGKSQSAAYKLAGFRPDDGAASRLSGNIKVRARIAELQSRSAEKALVTVEKLTDRLLKIAEKGEDSAEAPLLSVARASIMDAAKLNGLIVDRSKLGFDFSNLSDDELEFMERILARGSNT